MKILVFGDIYGRIGRKAVTKEIEILKNKHKPDFIIANVDNLTSGRGAVEKHILEMEKLGIDVFTGGDHIFDNFIHVKDYLSKDNSKLLRPANLFNDGSLGGKGYRIFEKNGKRLLVIHLLAATFMVHKVGNPFLKCDEILDELKNEKLDGIIVDFHKETTSEGYGLANYLDGRASAIFGTHTHVQTNDEIILENGIGLLSDVGMNGPLNSVIGASFASVKSRFITGINKGKIEQSLDSNYVVSACVFDIGSDGKCRGIEKIRIRNKLA